MPAKTPRRAKGRANGHSFVAVPHECLNHPNYTRMSADAIKLLFDLASQYKGRNNGDLTLAWSIMALRGWRSKTTLANARAELMHYGWIMTTRQGGKNACSLYAITWKEIDPCGEKIDCAPTRTAPGAWKQEREAWIRPKRQKLNLCPNPCTALPQPVYSKPRDAGFVPQPVY